MQRSKWEKDEPRLEGPAGWDWQQAVGALLLATGLIGVGFIWGFNWGFVDLARVSIN